jgi:hypothetical protein
MFWWTRPFSSFFHEHFSLRTIVYLYFGRLIPSSSSLCLFWIFINYLLFPTSACIMVVASIQRYIPRGKKLHFWLPRLLWLPIDCQWLPMISNDCQRLQWLLMIGSQQGKDYSAIPSYSWSFSSICSYSEPSSFIPNHSQLSQVILSVFPMWIYFCDSHFLVRSNYSGGRKSGTTFLFWVVY